MSTGGHYNPFGKHHGGRNSKEKHVGDLGNIEADDKGKGEIEFFLEQITLFDETSVIGRACILHEGEDDLGNGENENANESRLHGNAGKVIACGLIGIDEEDPNW
jgi:Cu-Zn family superoxide dismutase